ncbi:hypothetical protein [Candidatus Methylobacter oryzae]|uniref:Peptidase M48 domain-containing protein n=1 Tax=Candidatus Methylobacter oryzae TaxID=2497749 RepID=A0ABY3CC39_9GAMM|nr:hypothetical protein [Candidatus Methylobacter oryzae]TRW96423.1 hypothetical protein EKO24_008550 [Candidatus Methylobacter oryzae]
MPDNHQSFVFRYRFLILLVSGIFATLIIFFTSIFLAKPLPILVEKWITEGAISNEHYDLVDSVVSNAVENTRYSGMVNFNAPVEANSVNVYMVKRAALENDIPQLVCNCAYIGESQSIICDSDFFNEVLTKADLKPEDFERDTLSSKVFSDLSENMNRGNRLMMANWVLGHEVAHLLLNHASSQLYTFKPRWRFFNEKFKSSKSPHSLKQAEEEADVEVTH